MDDEVVKWILRDKEYTSYEIFKVVFTEHNRNSILNHIILYIDGYSETVSLSQGEYISLKREYTLSKITH